jgi:hypothetical protein
MASMDGFIDAYAVLGVAPGASSEELKRAHRALVRRHHPDLAPPGDRPAATARVQDINVAYGLVRDPAARAQYDRVRLLHIGRERVRAPGREAARRMAEADRSGAVQWEALVHAAGAWAAHWWRRHRGHLRRGALRLRRAGLDVVGRALWLASCALWALIGLIGATAAQRLAGADGYAALLVGVFGGLLIGSRRGWRRRLRLAGIDPAAAHRLRGPVELAAGTAALAGGALLDRMLL